MPSNAAGAIDRNLWDQTVGYKYDYILRLEIVAALLKLERSKDMPSFAKGVLHLFSLF